VNDKFLLLPAIQVGEHAIAVDGHLKNGWIRGGRLHREETTTMPNTPRATKSARSQKTVTVQLVCRIDPALNDQVRAHAARAGQTLTMFVARALVKATAVQPAATKRR
jgi:hypothetical protein